MEAAFGLVTPPQKKYSVRRMESILTINNSDTITDFFKKN